MATLEQIKRRFERGLTKPHIYKSEDGRWIARKGRHCGYGLTPADAELNLRVVEVDMMALRLGLWYPLSAARANAGY